MNRNNTNTRTISPFLEGVARTFDFTGSFDDPPLSAKPNPNPISEDWKTIGNDYKNSINIIGEDLNGNKCKPKRK